MILSIVVYRERERLMTLSKIFLLTFPLFTTHSGLTVALSATVLNPVAPDS